MRRASAPPQGAGGFAVVQTLIVAAIVVAVVAAAVPVYAARAKASVLQANARTLENEIRSYLALGFDATYIPDDLMTGQGDASGIVTEALRGSSDGVSSLYVNPFSGSRTVVCRTELPTPADTPPPAIWITDDQSYAHATFAASPEARSLLGGALVVVFIADGGLTSGIEVFYVDSAGRRSPSAAMLVL